MSDCIKISIWLVFLILISSGGGLVSQTYFYKQVKIVSNGNISVGDNSILFISFNSKGCYDSDKEGISVGNGFLNYMGKNDKIISYYGDCFWGSAYYYFSTDYDRLNIKLDDSGRILVYSKKSPKNEYTCSHIKEKKKEINNQYPIIVNNPNINDNYIPQSNSQIRGYIERVICTFCKGTGLNPACDFAPDYTGGKGDLYYCDICKTHKRPHTHGRCPSCMGKGYTEKYVTH